MYQYYHLRQSIGYFVADGWLVTGELDLEFFSIGQDQVFSSSDPTVKAAIFGRRYVTKGIIGLFGEVGLGVGDNLNDPQGFLGAYVGSTQFLSRNVGWEWRLGYADTFAGRNFINFTLDFGLKFLLP